MQQKSFWFWRISRVATVVTLCAAPVLLLPALDQQPLPATQARGYKLVFNDEFDKLDLSSNEAGAHTWYEGVWWTRKHAPLANISAANSQLSLTWLDSQASSDTNVVTMSPDGRHAHAWRYGYFEARMKWDPVTGAWPAFWMVPVQDATGQSTQNGVKESGEIDIFEGIGTQPHIFYGTVHDWVGKTSTWNKQNSFPLPGGSDFSQFHVYGLLWTPGKVTWYFDNQALHSESTPAVVDRQDFYIVLGMQEGVNWKFGDRTGVTASKMVLTIDWVRAWQKEPNR